MKFRRPPPSAGRFQPIRPFKLRPLFFKGGDNKIEDTEEQKALADIAAERWESYQGDFVDAENKYIEEMQSYDKDSRVESLEGSAAAGTTAAFNQARDNTAGNMIQAGINPNSGVFKAAIRDNHVDAATSQTDNVVQTGQAVQDQKVQGMKNIVAIGNGQAAQTLAGMGNIATASANEAASQAQTDAYEDRSNSGAAGFAIGAGAKAALGYGDDEDKA